MDLSGCASNGLWPFEDNSRNQPYALEYLNAHPTPGGSIPPLTVTWPVANVAESVSHPSTQFFNLGELVLYFTATTVSSLDASLNATQYTTYNADNPAATRAISSGGQWHVAGVRDMFIATNGVSLVYKLPSNSGGKVLVADASSSTGILVKTLCVMNGALVIGGLSDDVVAEAGFTELVEYWRARAPMDVVRNENTTFGLNWLIAGPPGGGENDVTYATMMALLHRFPSGVALDRFRSTLRTWIDQGLLSFHPLSTRGTIQKVLPYGKTGVMVYTTDHVYRLERREDGSFEENVVNEFGVLGRGAADGDDTEQGWVSVQGLGFKTQLGVGVTPLFGRPFLTSLSDATVACFDSYRRWFWFTDASKSFCVTDAGKWSRIESVRPMSLMRSVGSALYGAAVKDATDQPLRIKTCTFDGGPEMKRQAWGIGSVNCGSKDNPSDALQVRLSGKMEMGDAMTDFSYRAVDRRGRSVWNVGGVEFSVTVLADECVDADLSHLSIDPTTGPFSMRVWF